MGRIKKRDLDLSKMRNLAKLLVNSAKIGDIICLRGELGVGKTSFARLFIDEMAKKHGKKLKEKVISPTFTLVQIYSFRGKEIWHFDLYRIKSEDELYELGIEEAFSSAISLVEWPEKLGYFTPPNRLEVNFNFSKRSSFRNLEFMGFGSWKRRAEKVFSWSRETN